MRPFRFCPNCGSRLSGFDASYETTCPSCGRHWYDNPAPTAGCAVVDGEKALITIRARDPEKGRADVPGGFLYPGEHPVDGLKREVKEELGIDIDTSEDEFVSVTPHRYGRDGDWVLSLGFKGRLASGEPAPADDVADARWVRLDELDEIDFAWPHDRELVRRALEHG